MAFQGESSDRKKWPTIQKYEVADLVHVLLLHTVHGRAPWLIELWPARRTDVLLSEDTTNTHVHRPNSKLANWNRKLTCQDTAQLSTRIAALDKTKPSLAKNIGPLNNCGTVYCTWNFQNEQLLPRSGVLLVYKGSNSSSLRSIQNSPTVTIHWKRECICWTLNCTLEELSEKEYMYRQ